VFDGGAGCGLEFGRDLLPLSARRRAPRPRDAGRLRSISPAL